MVSGASSSSPVDSGASQIAVETAGSYQEAFPVAEGADQASVEVGAAQASVEVGAAQPSVVLEGACSPTTLKVSTGRGITKVPVRLLNVTTVPLMLTISVPFPEMVMFWGVKVKFPDPTIDVLEGMGSVAFHSVHEAGSVSFEPLGESTTEVTLLALRVERWGAADAMETAWRRERRRKVLLWVKDMIG